ncbi:MAG: ribosome maturation factor RimP [Flavobacteriales bacterium]|jgi:ribosome maturation factor RimP
MSAIQTQLEDLIRPITEALGCEFWGVEYFVQGKQSLLRVFIEKNDGVLVEDCERVSRQVSSVMDVEDLIKTEYTLEVSSPGLDRPLFSLDQFSAHIGESIKLRLRVALNGQRKFSGLLRSIENDEIVLEFGSEEYVLPFELIEKANVVPRF